MQCKQCSSLFKNRLSLFENRLSKMRVVSFIFKLACVIFFLNESFSCLQQYLHQETVSVSVLGSQETYGIPRICFAYSGFCVLSLFILQIHYFPIGFLTNELYNRTSIKKASLLTFNEYQRGNWSNEVFTARFSRFKQNFYREPVFPS